MARAFMTVTCLFAIALAGCGTCKKDLEDAKTQIADLTSRNQQLAEGTKRLEMEKSALAKEMAVAKDRNSELSTELTQAKKSLSNLAEKNEQLRKERASVGAELTKLKKENAELTSTMKELKQQAEPPASQVGKPGRSDRELRPQADKDTREALPSAAVSPCDAVIEYMRRSGAVIERYKGAERQSRLDQVRVAYADKMKDAPRVARETAEKWLQEMIRTWDQPADDSTFRTLQLRNAVLNACGKSPTQAGF